MALSLAEAGARLFLVARSSEGLEETAREIRARGSTAEFVTGDVADTSFPEKAVSACLQAFGALDVLVNNAGIAVTAPSHEMPLTEWERTLGVNLTAPFLFSQAAFKPMRQAGRGKIIQVASMFGTVGEPGLAAYCATKGGLIQLTRTLAIEWARYNIQVNAIAPGYFETEMTAEGRESEAVSTAMLRKIPARRFGRDAELGPLAVYLASQASDYMTGEVLLIDGGQTAR